MNKFKTLALLIGILIFGESAVLIYFANKSQEFSKKIERMENEKPKYEKIGKEGMEAKRKYEDLLKEYEGIKEDRNNLLTQVKILLGEKGKTQELSTSLEKANSDLEQLKAEKEKVEKDNLALKENIKTLQESHAQLTQEHDQLKAAYEKARRDTIVKELGGQISSLKKDNNNLDKNLRKVQKDLELTNQQIAQLTAEKEQLTGQLKDYKKNYADANRKNKNLEQEIRAIPEKFTEIARQNKVLLRQTAEMHYNLGVFYTKNKEYGRAVAEFEKVVEIDPDDAYAHFNLGYIYSEYLVNRKKAIEQFRHFLRLAKSDDADIDWVRKYLLTWETYEGKKPIQ